MFKVQTKIQKDIVLTEAGLEVALPETHALYNVEGYNMARVKVLEPNSGSFGKVPETLNISNVTADTTLTNDDSWKNNYC